MIDYMRGVVTENGNKELEMILTDIINKSEANRKWLESSGHDYECKPDGKPIDTQITTTE